VDDAPTAERRGRPETERIAGAVCATVECLALRAALTFEPCLRLTQSQCSALVNVLENIISINSEIDDDDVTAARLLEHFRELVAHYQKWRPSRTTSDGTRTKRYADMMGKEAENKSDTGSVSKYGGNDKDNRVRSSRITSGTGALRKRRSTMSREIPFRVTENITPETQAIVEAYQEWRQKNGYGKVTGRWG